MVRKIVAFLHPSSQFHWTDQLERIVETMSKLILLIVFDRPTPFKDTIQCHPMMSHSRFFICYHRLHVNCIANDGLDLVTASRILDVTGEGPLTNTPISYLTRRLGPIMVTWHIGATTPDGWGGNNNEKEWKRGSWSSK